ncbi:1,4-alpha-glucan branching protein [Methanocella sp. CWC-04]|uniref:1,4-alpha-glucan branching protein n=1 Tax=Methanooceanicella nereidis TaxID=2052831 RepID=A0AAP2RCS0_9EURY|nr:phosphoadenosine phosphosulfate reductase family protein [Methanocella sp. CWC-04]MCD1295159.1 1,4-alpha-glucan branching protein [Methanocella sp. CWC-04]
MSGRRPFENALDHIFWCDGCNVPLISENCDTCKGTGRKVLLSPPGDVRFCSPYERELIRDLFTGTYGCDPVKGRLILLNKIPGDDKTDEVIIDGHTIAVVSYDLKDSCYKLDLRLEGAKILMPLTNAKTVVLDVPRGKHLNGKGVSGRSVVSASPDIKKDDIILLRVSDTFNGYGVARTDSDGLKDPSENTIKIRKISSNNVILNDKASDIQDAVNANRSRIRAMEKDAVNILKGITCQGKNRELPVTVSFSGGKDSLVVLNLTRKAVKNYETFFIDTGLEFPETVKFVEDFAASNGINIQIEKAGNAFQENFPAFGPPAKDFRWCCKVCKLGPITRILSERKKGCITIDGKRRYESFQRGNIGTIERNPFVPGQMGIFPIKDWRAIEVWLYIHLEKLPYNELYDMGFERIGCWLCPAALQAEYVRMKEIHPDKFEEWQDKLYEWAGRSGLSREYVDLGFWRWKSHPNKMLNIAKEKGISLKAEATGDSMSLKIIRGISPCVSGGFSIEGVLRLPERAPVEHVLEMLKTIGSPVYSEDLDVTLVKAARGTSKLFAAGQVYASSDDKMYAQRLFEDTVKQVLRAAMCTRCGICVKACPRRAVKLDKHVKVDSNRCDQCGRCTDACVVARYYNKLTSEIKNTPNKQFIYGKKSK